jgi:predicted deacylase
MLHGFRIVTPDRGGLFADGVELGTEVAVGDTLARVIDPFGDVVEEISAPVAGVVLTIPVNPAVGTGTWAYEVGW